jgi:Uma2 family endonuclease
MSDPYEEIIGGKRIERAVPGTRHELICMRLHQQVQAALAHLTSTQLLAPRSEVKLAHNTTVRPDLALITTASDKLWLAAEIVSTDDHRVDTVIKKQMYEELKLPRLWMIDPRYDNVEIYHSTEYGLSLKSILAGREVLTEKLLPEFQFAIADLFKPE